MDEAENLSVPLGVLGALTGMLVPIAVVTGPLPQLGCSGYDCLGGSAVYDILQSDLALRSGAGGISKPAWRAWVDDPRGSVPLRDEHGHCPVGEATGDLPMLIEAPLPSTYDPRKAAGEMFACVLVNTDGRAADVRLVGAAAARPVSTALAAEIKRSWRFTELAGDPQWVRVRLDDGRQQAEPLPPLPDRPGFPL